MHKLLLVFSLLLAGSLAAGSSSAPDRSAAALSEARTEGYLQVTAHRGNSAVAPENTLSAMLKAVQSGAGYSELDVQETSDGVLVLMHDHNAKRTTGMNKNIWDLHSKDLLNASAGAWFSGAYAGEKVPTLEQVIEAVKGKMLLNIELKNNGHQKRLAESTVELLERMEFTQGCTVTSFDPALLQTVKRLNKDIKTGLIVSEKKADFASIFRNEAIDVISIAYPLLDENFMRTAAEHHKEVYAWTVNDRNAMERMMRLGVASIITDVPDQLIALVKQEQERAR
ncbi:glycerophosphodiester phosphodiesterase [Paenibacillus sp. HJGM_3]|uniref:glycerophosphodiester phosphodiesterase n=1 Tax=Paenibacillus sp. HJGM_3 TaxID=3379816 RepID=UPI00385CA5B2